MRTSKQNTSKCGATRTSTHIVKNKKKPKKRDAYVHRSVQELEQDIAEIDTLIERGDRVLKRLRERIIGFEMTLQWAQDQVNQYVDPSDAGEMAVVLECTRRDIDECKVDWDESQKEIARLREIREVFEELLVKEQLTTSRFL
jgi:hypothetical protein